MASISNSFLILMDTVAVLLIERIRHTLHQHGSIRVRFLMLSLFWEVAV